MDPFIIIVIIFPFGSFFFKGILSVSVLKIVNSAAVNFLSSVVVLPMMMDSGNSLSWTLELLYVVRAGFPWSILNLKHYLSRQSALDNMFLFTVQHLH